MSQLARQRTAGRKMLLLRLLICVSMWQGPLPWLHAHSSLPSCRQIPAATYAIGKVDVLSRHLKLYHRFLDAASRFDLGWHVHWMIPGRGELPSNATEPCDDGLPRLPSRDHDCSCSDASPVALLAWITGSGIPGDDALLESPSVANVRPSLPVSHFYEAFAASLSMPQRFSVYRC